MSCTWAGTMLMSICGVLCQSFCLLVKQLPLRVEQEGISPCSQNSTIVPSPELAESGQQHAFI